MSLVRLNSLCARSFSLSLLLCSSLLVVPLSISIAAAQEPAEQSNSATDKITLLDGSTLSAEVLGISETGELELAGEKDPLPLLALRKISRSDAKAPTGAAEALEPVTVQLAGGGRIVASRVTIEDEACQIRWAYGDNLELSIDALKALRFSPDKNETDFEAALAGESEELDRIFIRVEEKLQMVRGLIEEMTEKEITFDFEGQQTTLAREKVFGIIIASIGDTDQGSGQCLVELAGGMSTWGEKLGDVSLWGKVESLADGKLTLSIAGEDLELPWQSVKQLSVRSDRLTFLSDLKPAEATHQPIVAPHRPWQADRTVAGQTLTLRKRTFDKGIGMSPTTRLEFELDGTYETFSAVIGIDDETAGQGDAEFVVRGDGRELFRLQATGRDVPHPLQLDISRVRRLELILEPGEGLDLADHGDWCDACLIRPEKK